MKPYVFAASLLIATAAVAADPSGPPPGGPPPGPPIEMLARELGLDDYQKGEVKRIFEAQRQKMSSDREEMRQRMQQSEAEIEQQLSAVLTPEQLTTFKKLREERMKMGRRGPRPLPPDEE